MHEEIEREVELIPVGAIRVGNPRARSRKVFREIIDSIAQVGLKKPITVARKGSVYELVCGQGRLEAFRELGQKEIPAFVIDSDVENGMLMSLVENIARRQHRAIDLWRAARQQIDGLGESDVRVALEHFDGVWEELFPAEQARIIQLLVERVDLGADGADVRLRTAGLATLVADLRAGEPGIRRAA